MPPELAAPVLVPRGVPSLRFYFAVGAMDEILPTVRRAAAFETALGFETRVEVVPEAGHCEFNLEAELERRLDAVDQPTPSIPERRVVSL